MQLQPTYHPEHENRKVTTAKHIWMLSLRATLGYKSQLKMYAAEKGYQYPQLGLGEWKKGGPWSDDVLGEGEGDDDKDAGPFLL